MYRRGENKDNKKGDAVKKTTKSTRNREILDGNADILAEAAAAQKQFQIPSDSTPSTSKNQVHFVEKSNTPSMLLAQQNGKRECQYSRYDDTDQRLHHSPMSASAVTGHIASLPSGIASLPSGSRLNFDDVINKAKNAIGASEKR